MKRTRKAQHNILISQAGAYSKIDNNPFDRWLSGRKAKSRATNSIILYVLDIGFHKKKCLTLQSALSHPFIVNQVADCGYY